MEVEKVFHMNKGEGETSYVTNSSVQKTMILKAKPLVEETIIEFYCKTFPKCLTIADMGCSSGPNSLLVISEIINVVATTCQKLCRPSPEFQVFLNDLPGNDFNTIFKSVPSFYEKLRKDWGNGFGPCLVAGVPGSFYGRLFPQNTLNIVHSSNCLHWLSQVPQEIENNNGSIHLAKTSPPNVFQAYSKQFYKDFTIFLSSRSLEIVLGGRMIIIMLGRRYSDPSTKDCSFYWELLARSLRDMVSKGLIKKAELDSFNLPYYTPNIEEVEKIIQSEGSFNLDWLETFDTDWDNSEDDQNRSDFVYDKIKSGKYVANYIRAVIESIVVSHFGDSIMDDLFSRYAEHVGDHLEKERSKHHSIVICMTKNNNQPSQL
ncbi:hypothetical protein AQUCO_01000546v1 [Aquilegia coerulea]|uniref:Uncharacterized protein n=1 Tax=Aquilegia coerulea TaxID=218851 RepID=A0A2G5EAH7_AQUCA|nr:hypothetical protein AQUCO_01000546v1 [Aquilegia coerulea]